MRMEKSKTHIGDLGHYNSKDGKLVELTLVT